MARPHAVLLRMSLLVTSLITFTATTLGSATASDTARACDKYFQGDTTRQYIYTACHDDTGFQFDSSAPTLEGNSFCHSESCLWTARSIQQYADDSGLDCSGNSGFDFTRKADFDACLEEGNQWVARPTTAPPPGEGPSPSETPSPTPKLRPTPKPTTKPTPTPTPTPTTKSTPTPTSTSPSSSQAGSQAIDETVEDPVPAAPSSSSSPSPPSSGSAQRKGNTTELMPSTPTESIAANSGGGGGTDTISLTVGIIGGSIGALVIVFLAVREYRRRQAAGANSKSWGILPRARSNQGTASPSNGSHDHEFREIVATPPTKPNAYSAEDLHTEDSELKALCNSDALLAMRIPLETLVFGRFLSRGGFGEVYLGSYLSRRVAIKKILPEKRRDRQEIMDLLLEAERMATLQHERVVRIIGVAWNSLSELCVVSEYMTRGDLRTLLDSFASQTSGRPRGFADMDKVRIALHVVHGLAFLHSLDPQVLHRDLKSRNVLLDEDLNAKLTDFGVSRERSDGTMTACVGTSLWIAPEVLMGSRYDAKADVFSFGVLMSELDQHDLPYAHALDPDTNKKLPDTVILHRVTMGVLCVAFTGDNQDGEGDASLGDSAMAQLGRECVALDPAHRPDTTEVLHRVSVVWRKRKAREREESYGVVNS